jgi:AP-3 complex subunit beta
MLPFCNYWQDYIKDPNRRFVADTVAAIALCAEKLPSVTSTCLEGLLALVFYGNNCSLCMLSG